MTSKTNSTTPAEKAGGGYNFKIEGKGNAEFNSAGGTPALQKAAAEAGREYEADAAGFFAGGDGGGGWGDGSGGAGRWKFGGGTGARDC
jgi:hypothetical protein